MSHTGSQGHIVILQLCSMPKISFCETSLTIMVSSLIKFVKNPSSSPADFIESLVDLRLQHKQLLSELATSLSNRNRDVLSSGFFPNPQTKKSSLLQIFLTFLTLFPCTTFLPLLYIAMVQIYIYCKYQDKGTFQRIILQNTYKPTQRQLIVGLTCNFLTFVLYILVATSKY